ncbi:MAG TPA: sodium-independent anion transporter, partial [Pyrinomonadaceae bacterium]|nr:sodium-independent anion transporter [Pyrinomonadaceae bacterium]
SLLFFNADHFKDRVRTLIREAGARPRWFLLVAESIPILDITGAAALESLRVELGQAGTVLVIARAKALPMKMMLQSGLVERMGEDYFFPTITAGVRSFQAAQSNKSEESPE